MKNVRIEAGNLETLQRLVESGSGYTLLPWLATRQGVSNETQLIPFRAPVPQRQVSLVWRRTQLKKRAIEALSHAIVQSLPQELIELQGSKYLKGSEPIPAW